MAWFGAPLLFGQAGEAAPAAVEQEGRESWFAQTVRGAAMATALATAATTAHAQRVGGGWLPDELYPAPTQSNQTPTPLTLFVADRSVAMPVPWYWHQDALPTPPAGFDEGEPPPAIVVAWKVPGLNVWAFEGDDRLPVLDEEGFQPTIPRPEGMVAWLSAETGGYAEEVAAAGAPGTEGEYQPTAAPWPVQPRAFPDDSDLLPPQGSLADDEGAFMVVPVGPTYVLLPPPSGGSAPEPVTTIAGSEGEYQPPLPPVVPPVWRAPVEDADYLPRAAGDEGEYQPVPPALARPPLSPTWDTDDYPTPPVVLPGDEGEPPTLTLAPWLARPAPIWDEEGIPTAAAPIVEDEGTYFVMPVGPVYILLPPPSGGSAPEPSAPITVDEDSGATVQRLVAARPLFLDPVFMVDVSEAVSYSLTEDAYQPRVVVPWRAVALPPWGWGIDEYPNGAGPSPTFDDDPYRPAVQAPWRAIGLPGWVWGTEDWIEAPAVLGLSEDAYQPPMPRGLDFGLAWLSVETGGYAPDAPAVPLVDEDFYQPPGPINVRPVVLPVWDNENEFYLAPFFLDEDLDPDQIQRALPPVWRAVRPVWGLWDVDEARVAPVFPSGGQGTGRTHLFLGQIPDSATPTSAAGALYVLTGGYGDAAGTDTPLVIETPDVAPLGQAGRLRLRRIAVPFQYAAACTITVTPIVDYMTELDPVIVTYGEPGVVTRQMIQVKTLTACTVVRLRIEITARAGAVEFYRPSLFFSPLSGGTTMSMGGAP